MFPDLLCGVESFQVSINTNQPPVLLQALLSGECVGAVLGRSDWDLYRCVVCGNRAPLLAPRLAPTPAHD